jgi:hypothetical protein
VSVRLASCVVGLALVASCSFTQRHPAVTAGIVGGSLGFTVCYVDAEKPVCALVGAGAAVFLGGFVALVNLFADTEDHSLPSDEPEEPDFVRLRKRVVDAGVADTMTIDSSVGDAVLSPSHD